MMTGEIITRGYSEVHRAAQGEIPVL
jgi:hypothetical protein